MRVLSGNDLMKYSTGLLYRLDARTKMVICLAASVAVIPLKGIIPLSILLFASTVYALFHIRIRIILVCWSAVLLMGSTALLCLKIMTVFWPEIGKVDIFIFFIPFFRAAVLVNVILPLALSSHIQDILTSLKSFCLPLFIYLPGVVMIRFIPSFINDIKLISESLKIRGYRVNPVAFSLHPIRTTRLLFVPMVVRALRASDELSVAAELKGIGYVEKMTFYRTNKFSYPDYIAGAASILLLFASFLFEYKGAILS